ncbi:hypothetical protein HDV06_002225 [Boothiomyces sp. JEL0866]|nr:hypothetical protein HDV06_002225 [Boothiomyces sp. JEL0866]
MITHKVLVSPKFNMQNSILKQIGEHRNQLKIRPDHWVPFAVVSGIKRVETVSNIIEKCTKLIPRPLGYYRLPLATPNPTHPQFPGWKVPDAVVDTTNKLSTALNNDKVLEKEKLGPEDVITIHWERDEYQYITTNWPTFIQHEKLQLIRNRYPIVPGFDNKTRTDILTAEELEIQANIPVPTPTLQDFVKKPSTWKTKNEMPPPGTKIHRYGSKWGKSFPILKKDNTEKFKKLRELKLLKKNKK